MTEACGSSFSKPVNILISQPNGRQHIPSSPCLSDSGQVPWPERKGQILINGTQIGKKANQSAVATYASRAGPWPAVLHRVVPTHQTPQKSIFCFQLPPGQHQHYLSLAREKPDGANRLLRDPDTGCYFFFCCVSQLRCGTDGDLWPEGLRTSGEHTADGTKWHQGRKACGSLDLAGRGVKADSSAPCQPWMSG